MREKKRGSKIDPIIFKVVKWQLKDLDNQMKKLREKYHEDLAILRKAKRDVYENNWITRQSYFNYLKR